MEEWKKHELDKWQKNGYLPRLISLARLCTAPIWWSDPNRAGDSTIMHNGTMVFLHTGQRLVGVTAAHVFLQYEKGLDTVSELTCQVGNITFHGRDRSIAINDQLDLAVLDLSDVFISGTGSVPYTTATWPPAPLQKDDLVLFGGYPAIGRTDGADAVHFEFRTFLVRVASSFATRTSCVLNLADSYAPGGGQLGPGTKLGGMSGGPVFRYRDTHPQPLELAGFIYEYGTSTEIILVRQAGVVKPDGTIDHSAM